jgi:hypothetical protein
LQLSIETYPKEIHTMIDPTALATITASATVLGTEYLKGVATEAGKATWQGVKSLFGWSADPAPAEIAEKVASTLTCSPELTEKLVALLKNGNAGDSSAIVGNIQVSGGKVVIAQIINTTKFTL